MRNEKLRNEKLVFLSKIAVTNCIRGYLRLAITKLPAYQAIKSRAEISNS